MYLCTHDDRSLCLDIVAISSTTDWAAHRAIRQISVLSEVDITIESQTSLLESHNELGQCKVREAFRSTPDHNEV